MDELKLETGKNAMQPRIGRLIVLEGPNEVGKTTVSQALGRLLNERGEPSEVMAFPGRSVGSLGHHVYRLHQAPLEFGVLGMSPAALQALHVAAHLDAIEQTILPKLASGVNVILDRFWWSTKVYGTVTGVSERILDNLIAAELIAWQNQKPNFVIVLERDIPLLQTHNTDLFDRLREHYRKIVQDTYDHPAYIIRNDGTIERTTDEIACLLAP